MGRNLGEKVPLIRLAKNDQKNAEFLQERAPEFGIG